MEAKENLINAFLDIDRADSVFELLFVFVRDDGTAVQSEQTFESAISHIIGGVHLPKEILQRVRVTYNRTTNNPPSLLSSAIRLKNDLSRERPLLVMIFSILLRLAVDEGIMSREDRKRLNEIFKIFMFTREELELIPESLQNNLECFIYTNGSNQSYKFSTSLKKHFEILGCTPNSTLKEIRASYRRLAKKYHPDKQSKSNLDSNINRNKFEKVQIAYETITQVKTS